MPADLAAVRQLVFGHAIVAPIRVAYTASESATALDVPTTRIHRLYRCGDFPARYTGKRLIIAGGFLLDLLGTTEAEHPTLRDHRLHIQADASYTAVDIGVLLGISEDAANRLAWSGRLRPDLKRTRPLTSGRAILTYLDGTDSTATQRTTA